MNPHGNGVSAGVREWATAPNLLSNARLICDPDHKKSLWRRTINAMVTKRP
jgi:hypothetical protein